jgi:hypothetical protein
VGYFGLIVLLSALLNPITASLFQKFVLNKPGEGPSMNAMEKKFFLVLHADGVGSKGTQAEAVNACSFNRCVQVSRLSTDVREFESSGAKKGQLLFLLC